MQLILLTCLSLSIYSANATNLVINGSFEDDKITPWTQWPNIHGWTGFGDNIEFGQGSHYGLTGTTGAQFVELDSERGAYPTGLYQLIPTQNKLYTLSIDVAVRGGTEPITNGIEIWWRGAFVAAIYPTSTTFRTYTMPIQGSGGNDKLEIREKEGYDDTYGGMIDNLIIDEQRISDCHESQSQLVLNGSFENPRLSGGYTMLPAIPGWKKIGDLIEIGLPAEAYGVDLTGATGRQVAEIDANIYPGTTGFYQDITGEKKTYRLSVDFARRPGVNSQSCGVEVWWNNGLIATVFPTLTRFTTYTFNLPGIIGSNRLEFHEDPKIDDSYGGMIDNVNLIDTSLVSTCTEDPKTSGAPQGTSGPSSWVEINATSPK